MVSAKRVEDRKRERAWNAAARWKAIQDTITWAEAQPTVRRNEPAARAREEARKRREAVPR